jgi:hypothetical protein
VNCRTKSPIGQIPPVIHAHLNHIEGTVIEVRWILDDFCILEALGFEVSDLQLGGSVRLGGPMEGVEKKWCEPVVPGS